MVAKFLAVLLIAACITDISASSDLAGAIAEASAGVDHLPAAQPAQQYRRLLQQAGATRKVLKLISAKRSDGPNRERLIRQVCSVLDGKAGMDSEDRLPAWCDRRRK